MNEGERAFPERPPERQTRSGSAPADLDDEDVGVRHCTERFQPATDPRIGKELELRARRRPFEAPSFREEEEVGVVSVRLRRALDDRLEISTPLSGSLHERALGHVRRERDRKNPPDRPLQHPASPGLLHQPARHTEKQRVDHALVVGDQDERSVHT